jgi:hypothetical protein
LASASGPVGTRGTCQLFVVPPQGALALRQEPSGLRRGGFCCVLVGSVRGDFVASVLRPRGGNHSASCSPKQLQHENPEVCLFSRFRSFGNAVEPDGKEVRLFGLETLVSGNDNKMETHGRLHDHRVFRWYRVRVADGDRTFGSSPARFSSCK